LIVVPPTTKTKTKKVPPILHSNNPITKHKVGLLSLAEELGNVYQDCRIMAFQEIRFIFIRKLLMLMAPKL
jgi:hypothetical protein